MLEKSQKDGDEKVSILPKNYEQVFHTKVLCVAFLNLQLAAVNFINILCTNFCTNVVSAAFSTYM